MKVEIPLKYLKAARLFTADKDVRFCLKGVALKKGYVAATNGVYVGAIRCSAVGDVSEIVIPNESLDFLFKKAAKVNSADLVTVEWGPDRKGVLQIGSYIENFNGLDGVFPEFLRAIPKNNTATGHPQFDWDNFKPFQKAAVILGTKTDSPGKALLIPNGDGDTARVILANHPEFLGAISPLRPSSYAAALRISAQEQQP